MAIHHRLTAHRRKVTVAGVIAVAFFGMVAIFHGSRILALLGFDSTVAMSLDHTCWNLTRATLVEAEPDAWLIFELEDVPTAMDAAYCRLLVLSADDGSTLGQRARQHRFSLFGVTRKRAWIVSEFPGKESWTGLDLPQLSEGVDVLELTDTHSEIERIVKCVHTDGPEGVLRVCARNGRSYRLRPASNTLERLPLDPPPIEPSLLRGSGICPVDPGHLHDHVTCAPLDLGEICFFADIGEDGRLTFSGRLREGEPVWERGEEAVLGDASSGRRVIWSTIHRGRLFVAARDAGELDAVYVAAIEAKNGHLLWRKTFQ